MLPIAVVLATGVANASLDDTAKAPAAPPTTANWLSLTDHEQGQGPIPANPLAAGSWTRLATVDAPDSPPTVSQEPIQAFCEHVPVDPRRCTVTAMDAAVGAAIGAGIAAGVSAPVAITAGMIGAGAGFVAGIPFMPTGLVVGPLAGAAVGVAVVAGPAALLGGALGASVGAIVGITTPLPQEDGLDGSGAPTTSPKENAVIDPVVH
ncbi:hypothetical protein [Nocardia sp. NBC_01009]|uniref:hypothetical protein n=1 Tax=Nocardia sp. NBC_01009 TaxID=2975996 RepID=UPI003866E1C9|nr:hypothetical protein OHA42_37390 [Nocardia sp. NBC_01009]